MGEQWLSWGQVESRKQGAKTRKPDPPRNQLRELGARPLREMDEREHAEKESRGDGESVGSDQ
jgi:hypothetical protein